jgi:hypothetical protein
LIVEGADTPNLALFSAAARVDSRRMGKWGYLCYQEFLALARCARVDWFTSKTC